MCNIHRRREGPHGCSVIPKAVHGQVRTRVEQFEALLPRNVKETLT